MSDFKIRIPSRIETVNRPVNSMGSEDLNERAISATIEAAKNSDEATQKLTSMVMESLDVPKFREKLVEEALRDPELRTKIMIELIKQL